MTVAYRLKYLLGLYKEVVDESKLRYKSIKATTSLSPTQYCIEIELDFNQPLSILSHIDKKSDELLSSEGLKASIWNVINNCLLEDEINYDTYFRKLNWKERCSQ